MFKKLIILSQALKIHVYCATTATATVTAATHKKNVLLAVLPVALDLAADSLIFLKNSAQSVAELLLGKINQTFQSESILHIHNQP